jgi:hypothetical protein
MTERPKIAFVCHDDETLNRHILPAWAAGFADVVGIVAIRENATVKRRRIRAEARRVGLLRLLDVLAFRLYYQLTLAKEDRAWERRELKRLAAIWQDRPGPVPVCVTANPNEPQVGEFLRSCAPDLVIARCKWLLRKEIYSIARLGTFVLHPGICPEYRNSHGCFWALANRDLSKVGLTFLKIDDGIDTGPVYAYFSYPFDECAESHIRIQHRMVTENLDGIRQTIEKIVRQQLSALDTKGRVSKNWGQPWLSKYVQWKRAANTSAQTCR